MISAVRAPGTCFAIGLALVLANQASPALAQPFTLTTPAPSAQSFSLTDSVSASAVQTIIPRLTTPEPPHEVLHDTQTGTKTAEFGIAYSYANPLYGTNRVGVDEVGGNSGGGGAGVPNILSFVVARWGYPPKPLPRIAGLDTRPVLPDVPMIRYLMHADSGRFPDQDAARVMDLVLHGMGRARTTEIDIALPPASQSPGEQSPGEQSPGELAAGGQAAGGQAAGADLLRRVALALVHEGVHPAAILFQGMRVLPRGPEERGSPVPGHRISLVLAAGGEGG